jgi:hypothetical protein
METTGRVLPANRLAFRVLIALLAVLMIGLTVWLLRKVPPEAAPTANSVEFALTEDELRDLPSEALRGNCKAATRLGIFYFAVMGDPGKAEQWLRLSAACSADPMVKEFLVRCISLDSPTREKIDEVKNLLRELDAIDPVRSQRLRPSLEKYVRSSVP